MRTRNGTRGTPSGNRTPEALPVLQVRRERDHRACGPNRSSVGYNSLPGSCTLPLKCPPFARRPRVPTIH